MLYNSINKSEIVIDFQGGSTMNITSDIRYIGVNDHDIDLFEGQYAVPNGMAYNSYVIMDEKIAVMDTVDGAFCGEWLGNLEKELSGRTPDFLVVHHMEPDHSANIAAFAEKYPAAKIVASRQAFVMMKQFFGTDYADRQVVAAEKSTLELGKHTLPFIGAPMVHWPEAMVTYDDVDKVLFSADGFGSFGALNGNVFADEVDFDRDWLDDARRYYTNIVGKYGASVQTLLKKAAGLEIAVICPLHGPIWRENLSYILEKYQKWSTYEAEDQAVVIMYASMYGNTASAADALAGALAVRGVKKIAVYDVSNAHVSELISEIFRASHLVFAAPTYNAGIYPVMENLLSDMKALAVQKKTVAVMENGTWAPTAAKQVKEKISEMKDMTILDTGLTIKSAMHADQKAELDALADAIVNSMV